MFVRALSGGGEPVTIHGEWVLLDDYSVDP